MAIARRLTDLAIICRQAKRVGTTIPARRQAPEACGQAELRATKRNSTTAHGGQLHCIVRRRRSSRPGRKSGVGNTEDKKRESGDSNEALSAGVGDEEARDTERQHQRGGRSGAL